MFSEGERRRLNDIVENIAAIDDYLVGMDLAGFMRDRKTADATERCLARITEAVIQIGADRMADIAPDLPVFAVRGLGNELRHAYHRIDPETIYNTVRQQLPELKRVCLAALGT